MSEPQSHDPNSKPTDLRAAQNASHLNSAEDSDGAQSSGIGKRNRPFRLGSCLLKLLLLSVVAGGILFFVQQQMTPDVDPAQEQELQIVHGEQEQIADPGSDAGDGNSSTGETVVTGEATSPGQPKRLTETISMKMIADADHPLEPLLDLARLGIEYIDENVQDYSATIVSRVRIGRRLGSERAMKVKIRHQRGSATQEADAEIATDETFEPFSVYTKFLKPRSLVGREAIWIEGENEGLILAHLTGLLNVKTFHVDPVSPQAMSGSRHPIYKVGVRNLIVQMIDYGKNDMKYQECEVTIERNVVVDGHACTMLKIVHPKYRDHFEFHIAKIYLDDERQIPIGYEGFLWPERAGQEPPLLERYFYRNIELNVGLTDEDFDSKNKNYEYPTW
jgi:hypothetical protein